MSILYCGIMFSFESPVHSVECHS